MNHAILKHFNLNEKQAKVYLACLELGLSTVYAIAKKAQLPRTSVYEVLHELAKNHIVVRTERHNITMYQPVAPEILLKELKDSVKQVESLIPELKLLFSASRSRPAVKIYEGREGLVKAREEEIETAKKTKQLSAFATMKSFSVLSKYFPGFRDKRVQYNIFALLLLADTPEAHAYKIHEDDYCMKVKMLPKEYELTLSLNICANKTFIFSIKKDIISVVIESKEIADNFQKIFNFVWHSLP